MKVRRRLPDALEVHVYGGAVLISVGAGLWFPPAGLIACGALLIVIGYLG